MRITTQMMHASAKRAGISLEGASLLNYINKSNTRSTQNTLLSALSKKTNTVVSKTQAASYEKLEKTSNSLLESLESFLKEGEDGIFQKADKKEIIDTVKQMVKRYNETVKALQNTANPLNDFYGEMLKEAAEESEAGLAVIGITQNENGTLTLDEEKFESTEVEKIKVSLDGNGLFTTKTAYITSRIFDNAKTNSQSYSTQYGADGYSYVTNNNNYDFWG